jgi:hypothetical protein
MNAHRGIGKRVGGLLLALVGALVLSGTAQAQNVAPVISGTPPTTATPGVAYSFTPTASDPNGDRLAFTASGTPQWAGFDRKTGRLSGTPTLRHAGRSFTVVISVSDGKLSASLPPFTITVGSGSSSGSTNNGAPTISGTPSTSVVEGELYGFAPTASDPNGDRLQFSITGKPSWASFAAKSGLLSGIPPAGTGGTYPNIVISVNDGTSTASLPAFGITVAAKANSAPTIWGIPVTSVDAGSAYSFRPSASDPDGQTLRFGVQGMPSWASFDTATGTLGGTPSSAQAGTYSGIVISVSDGLESSSLAPYSITVAAANRAPVIGGTPPDSVMAGQSYGFTPSASDPDGQRLTFAIANKPDWATFDAATGRLTGAPADTQAGTYSGIEISASDGTLSTALPAFSVTVLAQPKGSATVSWVPPTTHVDGSPLTNLAGYRIVYGQSADQLTASVNIPSAVVTTATLENLAAGTWYFAVKAYTTTNVESDLSQVGQKTVN